MYKSVRKGFIKPLLHIIKTSVICAECFKQRAVGTQLKVSIMTTQVKNLAEQAKELYLFTPFGLSVITKYSGGKITAKMTHGNGVKVSVRVSYDCGLSTGENHIHAALVLLEKVKVGHGKEFAIVMSSYNEKDDGYTFTTQRIV